MKEVGFTDYQRLSTKRSELIEAFDYYEKIHETKNGVNTASLKYCELLTFWRNELGVSAGKTSFDKEQDIINIDNILKKIEAEFVRTYSPIELSQEKIDIYYNEIKNILDSFDNDTLIEGKVTFLLSHLLYNILLLKKCFFPIDELPYEDFLSNIRNSLNKCIIISQADHFNEYFEEIVSDFNADFISVKDVTPHILNVVGVLNFKCHKYKEAIALFVRAIKGFETSLSQNVVYDDEYFQIKLLLAYCYEYNHDFESAIKELIGIEVNSLLKLYNNSFICDVLDEKTFTKSRNESNKIIENIKKASNKNLDNNNLLYLAIQRDERKQNGIGDVHEVLHSLGHCLNELGIKEKMTPNKNRVVMLLNISRLIMLEVAEHDESCEDFQTCLYMLYGEAKDYDICLNRINTISNKINKQPNKNINLRMENLFYKFLVSNQANKVILDDNTKIEADDAYHDFKKFALRRYDYDALIHIEIIRFRSQIINILMTGTDDATVAINLDKLRTEPEGKSMFGIKPSAKLNKWIVQEYNKTIALYEFLVKYFDQNADINTLYNFACRFCFFHNQFEENSHSFLDGENKTDAIERTISLIMEDVISPQSIFLLAPLSSAIPYQHQTRSLLQLESELFIESEPTQQKNDKLDKFQRLHLALRRSPSAQKLGSWLFDHGEYAPVLMITKLSPDKNNEYYYYEDKNALKFKRPIHNIESVDSLFRSIAPRRTKRRHQTCVNGQTRCCITVVDEMSPKSKDKTEIMSIVNKICFELMIPTDLCEGKHFIIDCRTYETTLDWTVLIFDKPLSKVHWSEIVYHLCGHDNVDPEYKLAISKQDYCFICYTSIDASIATSDILYVQEKGFHLWPIFFKKEVASIENELLHAKVALFYLSPNTFKSNIFGSYNKLIAKAKNIDSLIEKTFFIGTNFEGLDDFKNQVCKHMGNEFVDFLVLRTVLRKSSEYDDVQHLDDITKKLIENGVGGNVLR